MDEQDRRDMLRGRVRRLEDEYHKANNVFFSSLHFIGDALLDKEGYPKVTAAYFEREIQPTFGPRLAALSDALLAWLRAREELAQLEKPDAKR